MADSPRKQKSRKHHFLPQFYLAGFTDSGNKEGTLWVLDKENLRQWESNPKGAAYCKDYYKIDVKDADENAVENAFGEFEGQAADVIRRTVTSEQLPKDEDFIVLMNCVALFWARVPRIRNIKSRLIENILKKVNRMMVASPQMYKGFSDRMRQDGKELPEGADDYEAMKRFVESDEYTVDFDQTWHVRNMLEAMDKLMPILMKRSWSLLIAQRGAGSFICSDSPVTLTWTKDIELPVPPGFALKHTAVAMPLNSRITLLGEFDRPSVVAPVPLRYVAYCNSLVAATAQRFVYSTAQDFPCITRLGTVGGSCELLQTLKDKRDQAAEENAGPPDASR
jgi:hypothetical protein